MRFLRDDSGLSLTELLVVSMLISVILAASYFMFAAAQSSTNIAMARSVASEEAQKAIELMSRELRQAQEDVPSEGVLGPGVFTVMGASDMQFLSDVDHDGNPEKVRYYVEVSGGISSLKRTVARQTNSAAVPPTYGTPGTPTILIKRLGATSAGPVFCYHSTVVPAAPIPLCGTANHGFAIVPYVASPYGNAAAPISMVGIKLEDIATSGDKTVTVINSVLVRMRTVQNLL